MGILLYGNMGVCVGLSYSISCVTCIGAVCVGSYVKTAACCKHFFAYSLEDSDGYTRHNFNANVSMQDMMETYGPPFEMCVAAQPEQIMCSYNAVNGTYSGRASVNVYLMFCLVATVGSVGCMP